MKRLWKVYLQSLEWTTGTGLVSYPDLRRGTIGKNRSGQSSDVSVPSQECVVVGIVNG